MTFELPELLCLLCFVCSAVGQRQHRTLEHIINRQNHHRHSYTPPASISPSIEPYFVTCVCSEKMKVPGMVILVVALYPTSLVSLDLPVVDKQYMYGY